MKVACEFLVVWVVMIGVLFAYDVLSGDNQARRDARSVAVMSEYLVSP